MRIYTKTGDGGTTGLIGGSRTSKSSPRIHAIGDVDEANAAFGVVRCSIGLSEELSDQIEWIQSRLFDVGAALASTDQVAPPLGEEKLEKWIDAMVDKLPPLREFILPGGSAQAALLHQARAVTRRAERSVIALSEHDGGAQGTIVTFLNRLSDWAFTAARYANLLADVTDEPWRKEES